MVDVGELDVLEGYVLDVAGACGVGFDPCSIGAVDEGYVVEYHIVDVFCYSSVFADATDAHSTRLMTNDIAHMDVAAVGFD